MGAWRCLIDLVKVGETGGLGVSFVSDTVCTRCLVCSIDALTHAEPGFFRYYSMLAIIGWGVACWVSMVLMVWSPQFKQHLKYALFVLFFFLFCFVFLMPCPVVGLLRGLLRTYPSGRPQ